MPYRLKYSVVLVALTLCSYACDEDSPLAEDADVSALEVGTLDQGSEAGAELPIDALAEVEVDADVSEDSSPLCGPANGLRPARRSEHSGIYDDAGARVIVFGGSFGVPINCGFPAATFESELWAYDVACDRWTELSASGGPAGRVRHMMAYDSQRRRAVVFGGRSREGTSGPYTLFDDLWSYDLEADSWSEVTSTTPGPSARVNGAFVYDPSGDRLLLFGGNASASGAFYMALNDLWQYSFATGEWSEISVTGAMPSPRLFTAAVWDDGRQSLVMFGGADESAFSQTAQYFDELWTLEFAAGSAAWTLHVPSTEAPAGRFWSGLAHDEDADRYVLFGGHDDETLGNRNDFWTFDPTSKGWVEHGQGDVFNKPANGFCDFPPDFTVVDEDLPERRNSHVFVSDGHRGFAMGGKTDCGVVDDLWSLEYSTMTWSERTAATVGEACVRKGGLNCTDMCL